MRLPFRATRKALEIGDSGHDALRRKWEGKIEREVRQALSAEQQRVLDQAPYAFGGNLPPEFWSSENELMRAALLGVMNQMMSNAVDVAIADLGEMVHVGLDSAAAHARVSKWARNYSYELIKNINPNTRRAVQEAMRNWFEMQGTVDDLAEMLKPTFGKPRARMIAETEVTRAFARAHHESWKETPIIQGREWRTAMDERVCPICGALDSEQAVIGQPFVGIEGTLDDPPAHPRCRCWTVPVIMEVVRLG